jgi:hypothetical protein
MPERRTPIAILEDRGNKVDRAIARLAETDAKSTPPAAIRALFAELRGRLDSAEASLLRPAGQISLSEVMERALRDAKDRAIQGEGPTDQS